MRRRSAGIAGRRPIVPLLLAAWLVAACGGSGGGAGPALSVPPGVVEIRQYQGQNLTAARDIPGTDIAGPQQVSLDTYRLKVTGLVNTPLELTYDQVLGYAHSSKVVTLHCVEGWDATILWEGVRIDDILAQAGVEDGAPVVIFHAVDGYTSSLPLEYVRKNNIMLAFAMNGVTLPAERGFPFQVVAESKWGYKWVKWVDRIELSDDTSYHGYWEVRGYNNDGDQSGPILEP
jgi:DMSO/TMAO reductase YedYZ molybdopterin-dependent catalytic subunit